MKRLLLTLTAVAGLATALQRLRSSRSPKTRSSTVKAP